MNQKLTNWQRHLVLNFVFIGVLLLVQVWLAPLYLQTFLWEGVNVGIGVFLLLVLVLEPIGIAIKVNRLDRKKMAGWALGLWITHLGISGVVFLSMLQFFGVDIESGTAVPAYLLHVLKEFVLLLILWGMWANSIAKLNRRWSELAADAILILTYSAYYLGFWWVVTNRNLVRTDLGGMVLDLLVMAIIFAVFFVLPARLVYFLEELQAPKLQQIQIAVSLVIMTAVALVPFV